MAIRTTMGQILVNNALPESLRDYHRTLDKDGMASLLKALADAGPDTYRRATHGLIQVGRDVAYRNGGFSFGLDSLKTSKIAEQVRQKIEDEVHRIDEDDSLDDDAREAAVIKAVEKHSGSLVDDVFNEAKAAQNPLAMQVLSGARGKPFNVASLVGFDRLYVDHRGDPVPVPILNNYSRGLSPAEYFAGAYGARKGVIDTKMCLAAGTLVAMADGTAKPIEQVTPGDKVLAFDAPREQVIESVVVRTYDNGVRPCVRVVNRPADLYQGEPILDVTLTRDHRVLAAVVGPRGITFAKRHVDCVIQAGPAAGFFQIAPSMFTPRSRRQMADGGLPFLEPGDRIGQYGNGNLTAGNAVIVTEVGEVPTYDIEVDHPDHLFLLANGLVVENSTAQSGFFGKQLVQAAHRLVVTAQDAEEDDPHADHRGLPVDVRDPDNEGALLAREVGGYPRNQILSSRVLADLRDRGIQKILVRSPLVGGPADGGVYARDVGVRERGRLAPLGEFVGITAAQAIGEKLSQGMLCLAAGTLIQMADRSTKAIELVQVGDMVLGADRSGVTFPVRVVSTFDNGIRPCHRTSFKRGQTREMVHLDSTLDHKILCVVNKWSCKAQAMNGRLQVLPVGTVGRDFSAVMPEGYREPEGLVDDPFDLLLGLLLGDGCYTDSVNGVHLSCFDDTLPPELEEYLASLNLRLKLLEGQRGYYRISQVNEVASERDSLGRVLGGFRNPIRRYLGDREMLGKYAHEKVIPDEVWGWSNASIARLIGGLVVSDGSVYLAEDRADCGQPYVGFGSTSRRMAEQVRELLAWRFGIYATQISENDQDRKRSLWTFTISNQDSVLKFAEVIPLFGVKRPRLTEALAAQVIRKRMRYYKCGRKAMTPLGDLPTYDIEVDHPDHLFVLANGLVVSNSSKHAGGVAGAEKATGGFGYLNSLVQVPRVFPDGATHAQSDGRVEQVVPAPQGGHYVTVAGQEHYVPASNQLHVKVGDEVEAGDSLDDGIPNPAEIVKHKGLGEGRRYFVKAFGKGYANSGMKAHRRNLELIARGLINHVELDDEIEDTAHVPGDVVPYSMIERTWKPREGAQHVSVGDGAVGRYLERPVLHHTIGTRIRKSMLPELREFGINNLLVHDNPPPFSPVMVRGMANLQHDEDWMTRQLGSGLQRPFLDAAARGGVSDASGTSYVPAMVDRTQFGRQGLTRGWTPEKADMPALPKPPSLG